MCGVCGFAFADSRRRAAAGEVFRMTAALEHRGPDAPGSFEDEGIAIGFRRLAIIDLQSGDQPISNEDGTVTVACNGEIYNFIELREELESRGHRFRTRSDVETIVHLYEDFGPDCVRHLRGMFAFAIWDGRERQLMLARDRFGIKPMHYALGPDRLDFASEQKAILAGSAAVDRTADADAVQDLLDMGFIPGARTLLRGIRRLLPAHYLLYRRGSASIHRYWDISFSADRRAGNPKTAGEWAEALRDKLQESVRLHMRSDVPVGALLSPGIDSSAVTAIGCGLTNEPIQSVTLGYDSPHLDETRRFPTLDRYPGFNLTNRQVRCGDDEFRLFPKALHYCEEPTDVMIPRMVLCEAAARSVKVVLTGEGSDEILGGYPWYRHDKLCRPFSRLPLRLRRLMLRARPPMEQWNDNLTRLFLAQPRMDMKRYRLMISPASDWRALSLLGPALRERRERNGGGDPVALHAEFDRWDPFQQLQYLDLTVRLPEDVNHSLDRASMAWGLEARLPFLDHELAEFCARIPVALKLRRLEEKHILRRAMARTLPPEIVGRRKRGMGAPMRRWWQGDLPGFAAHALSRESLCAAGYFRPDAVERMLDPQRGDGAYAWQLNAVLAVQLKHSQGMLS
jgi:asparagine synthase (glutamine-hydrolysing)